MTKKYTLYGIGAALVDTEITASDQDLETLKVAKGLMTLVDEPRQAEIHDYFSARQPFKKASGGSVANSLIAASYFGSTCYFTGKVADDEDGHFYLHDMQSAGIDCITEPQLEPGVTGKCLVLITPDAERSMNTFLGASETLSTALLNDAALDASHCVYIEGYLVSSDSGRHAARTLIEKARQQGITVAVSLSDPGIVAFFREPMQNMFGGPVDLLFCNSEEAIAWCQSSSLEDAEQQLKKTAAQYAITLGADGAIIWDGQQRHRIAGQSVAALDTNGAGDLFAGAYLHAIHQGHSAARSGEFACYAAAQVVQQYGPRLSADDYRNLAQTFFAKTPGTAQA